MPALRVSGNSVTAVDPADLMVPRTGLSLHVCHQEPLRTYRTVLSPGSAWEWWNWTAGSPLTRE